MVSFRVVQVGQIRRSKWAKLDERTQDPVFGILAGREELDEPLAGKSTLNRMELGAGTPDVV